MALGRYGCLYYTEDEPRTVNKIFIPVAICRHRSKDLSYYGGHLDCFDMTLDALAGAKDTMPSGEGYVRVEDIVEDIPPVQHCTFKSPAANELALIMFERLIFAATNEEDVVRDPFGGAGTNYHAAEQLNRLRIGMKLGDIGPIVRRIRTWPGGSGCRSSGCP